MYTGVIEMAYKAKKCDNCSKLFIPISSTQMWCSDCLLKSCENCGKQFKVRNKSKFEKSRYCSVSCKRAHLSKIMVGEKGANYRNGNRLKSTVMCDNCGTEFRKDNAQIKRRKHHFCGRKCQIEFYQREENKLSGEQSPKYSKVNTICEWCGKTFKSYKSTAYEVRFCSMNCRNNWQSEMMRGENHYNWRGGITGQRQIDMARKEYRHWRISVFQRDKYTCQICGDSRGGNLRAHHIKPYSVFKNLRYDIDNGITVCDDCHKKIHSQLDIQSDPQYNLLMKLRRLAEMTSPTESDGE